MTRVTAMLHWLATPIRAADARCWAIARGLKDPEARKAAALLLLAGGGMTWTLIAIAEVVLLRRDPRLFWLAVAAHIITFVVITGFGSLLYKRSIRISREGMEIVDADPKTASAAVTPSGQAKGED